MAKAEDIERAKHGKKVWNAWARENSGAEVDFSGLTERKLNFKGFIFPGRAFLGQ